MSSAAVPREPQTPEEWQEAVDAAYACLALDAAHAYGLVERQKEGGHDDVIEGSGVNVARCEELLARGAARGYEPRDDAIERFARELRS